MNKDENFKILIVDDSVTFRGTLEKILNELGYINVGKAKCGEEAFLMIEDAVSAGKRLDLIICDQHMDEMSGLNLLEIVRDLKSKEDNSIIECNFIIFTCFSFFQTHNGFISPYSR